MQSAFGTYLLSRCSTAFPREILEAAEIDGASAGRCCGDRGAGQLRPTLVVLVTFFFIWTWNEFLLPLVFLVSNDNQTVSVAMGVPAGPDDTQPDLTAARGAARHRCRRSSSS